MIQVKVMYQAGLIKRVTISGHAQSDVKGKDLVCAGVSAIGVGTLNALHRYAAENIHEQLAEGYIYIEVIATSPEVETMLQTMLIQLETIHESYSSYIEIIKTGG